ncbi:adenylate/guanylate cyclase domain-containing protein [Bradyrhizobium sp. 191]|uniref:adenylate/guanylate cyclase domain-containing protein n=1 Tax=Bradyrhizobium sp. 191 TaxID=2782659 RepID=UPI001FFF8C80|nr:adenylate/guanylate cyclase domain-containing protein [Bradyrhizobium sp. 191]UPJ62888.1 AAA family ATPase [Bradyrhizobium sp. 191]
MNVTAWLHGLGLGRYEQAFRENDIDASVLARLTGDDLIGIGVASVGHRRKLLTAIAELRDGPTPTPRPVPSAPAATPRLASPLPDAERRQVTVLFADIAGYTKLADELDAEEVHTLLESFFDLADASVVDHGGTVDKHIGDCVMAVFGAPVAYGNDPERCVQAALDIGSRMPVVAADLARPISVHIGIASGEVMASDTGSARHVEYTVTGESVNLASRLKDMAPPGEIFISDSLYRALAERVDCSDVGELTIKGLAKPVRVWRLHALRKPARSSRQAFVGRHRELRELEAALVRCRNTLHGRTIYIRGEAGIGKTRLLEQFRTTAERQNFACHGGLVLDFGMGSGQDAIRSLVRSLLGLSGESSEEEISVAAEKTIADGMLANERRVYLNDLLNLPQPTGLRTLYDAMDNPARNRGKRATVTELVTNASGHRPLLLAIEDVHWADQMTLAHLSNLAETVAGCPALLVMTSRLERDLLQEAWVPTIAGLPMVTIDLGPLQPTEANRLAEAYFGEVGELAQRCVERADGNPLFLEQLLRHAEESAEGNVPGSIRSLVQARLDRLPLSDKRALQAASVLGQRFTAEALAALLDQPGWSCAGLMRHLLVRSQGDHFLFAHALIQEGVYDTLLRSRRRELHRKAADWFRSRDLMLCAQHLDRGDDDGAPRAFLEAARAQAAEYRTERALRLVERGVALANNRADLSALHLLRGEILHDLGLIPESIAAFEQALAVADADIERCRAWLGLAAGLRVTDRFDEAFAMLDKAASAAMDDLSAAERARIHHLRGNLCFPLGRLVECLHQHERALDCARIASSPELEARALGGLGDAEYARGRMASAHRHFSGCVELSGGSGHGRIEVANLSMVAHTQVYLNDFSEALATSQMAIELAARVGHHRAEIIAHNAACNVFRTTGEFARAKIHADRALLLAQCLGAKRFEAVSLNDLAMVARSEASKAEAMDLLRRALMIARETGMTFVGPWILGHLAVTTDDSVELQTALAEGEDILRKGAVAHNHLWFFRYAVEASLHSQDWKGAERYSAALEDFTRAEPLPWANFFVRYGRTVCALGRGRSEQVTTWQLRDLLVEAERLGIGPALGPLALVERPRQQDSLT